MPVQAIKFFGNRRFEPFLRKWIALIIQSCKEWDWEDCPWWTTERALVSTLAAAAWQNGGVALEEYSNEKKRGGIKYSGRCDLYMKISKKDYIAEAKICWPKAGKRARKTKSIIEEALKASERDAKKLRGFEEEKMGIVFAVPMIPKAEGKEISTRIKEWQSLVKRVNSTAMAWVFPQKARKIEYGSYIYPGVSIFLILA
jgi:hypothetical protein